jgi:hypothetical protein
MFNWNNRPSRAVRPLLTALVIGLVWLGCTQDQAELTGPADRFSGIQEGLRPVVNVQERYTEQLLSRAGVVGTAVGLDSDGEPVIKIFTAEEGIAGLPESLEGVPVTIEVTGMFYAFIDPTARQPRPVPTGVSTGHPNITAGTIGARVTDGTNVFALSNNHVYANINKAGIGDNVLQPGAYDGGVNPADAIGTLYDFEPIKFAKRNNAPLNQMDAAIALTTTGMLGFATPAPADGGYGAPSSTTVAAFVGQHVQKYGRTTRLTQGTVEEINVIVDVCYGGLVICTKWARFNGQVSITPGDFSAGGDSGSLIVTDDLNKYAVGLLFAGSSARTIANPIGPVLNAFGVTIDDGTGSPPPPPPPPPPPGGVMHVGDLDGSDVSAGRKWIAEVAISLHDADHNPVADASVSGSWSGVNGGGSCTTDSNGQCTITRQNINTRIATVTFTVTDVAHTSLSYDSTANHDPDGDSDGTSVNIDQP